MSAGGAPTSQDTEPATPHTCISSAAARPKPAPTASEAPQRKLCTHVKAKTPLAREYAVPEVGLELPSRHCRHWEPAKTCRIRSSPRAVGPDLRPKVWTLSTPRFPPVEAFNLRPHPERKGCGFSLSLQIWLALSVGHAASLLRFDRQVEVPSLLVILICPMIAGRDLGATRALPRRPRNRKLLH